MASSIRDSLTIGPIQVPNRAFLAPMSGVTDVPFRRLAARLGAGLVVSEMVASEELVRDGEEAHRKALDAGARPFVVQLMGREPYWMAEGARIAAASGADIVDINMGCPARKVTNGAAGSALMRDLDEAVAIVRAVVHAAGVPVTLKMRLGWDGASMNAPELARRAEAEGVAMVTVHGRTRCQFYKGRADWPAIARVREAISVPLVANGDVETLDDVDAILAASGADAVMIGRGAYGRPWFAGHAGRYLSTGKRSPEPDAESQFALLMELYAAMLSFYGADLGTRIARKHIAWTLDRLAPSGFPSALRARLLGSQDPAEVGALLRGLAADSLSKAA